MESSKSVNLYLSSVGGNIFRGRDVRIDLIWIPSWTLVFNLDSYDSGKARPEFSIDKCIERSMK